MPFHTPFHFPLEVAIQKARAAQALLSKNRYEVGRTLLLLLLSFHSLSWLPCASF